MKRTKTKKIWVAIMIAALIAGVGGCYYPYRHYDYDYHRLDDRYYGHRDYDHDRW
jgi:hypothetical protein